MSAKTSHSRPRSRRGWRSVVRWIALGLLGVVALVLLIAALALPAYARGKTREFLQSSKGISGDFLDVQTSLFPLTYTVTHLKIRKNDAVLKDPFFYADRLAVHLRWAPLLTGRFVGNVAGEGVKVVIEQPPSGGGVGRHPSMEDIIPVKAVVERVHVKNSEALYAWVREERNRRERSPWPTT